MTDPRVTVAREALAEYEASELSSRGEVFERYGLTRSSTNFGTGVHRREHGATPACIAADLQRAATTMPGALARIEIQNVHTFQGMKSHNPDAYRDMVLLEELGMRAFQSLEEPEQHDA